MLRLLQFAENVICRWIFQELISWGPHSSLEGQRKIRRRLFASSIKRAVRHFDVVVVQWRQRNVQKKRDARANLLFFLINLLLFDVLVTVAVVFARAPLIIK